MRRGLTWADVRASGGNSVWIWTAEQRAVVAGLCGGRTGYGDFLALVGPVASSGQIQRHRYAVYNWLPPDHHVARKGREANRNEGLHSVLRGKLHRLARRTKGYTKKVEMISGSLALLWLQQGWI